MDERTIVVTLVGGKNDKDFEWILSDAGLKTVNTVNSGMFGNFSTLTYYIHVPEKDDMIVKRRTMMALIEQRLPNCMALYEHGNWNRIFVMKQFREKNSFYNEGIYP